MARIEFCDCSQKGSYGLGVITLATGELACKNCRGVIPPADVSEELLQRPVPIPKAKVAEDYRLESKSKSIRRSGPATLDDLVNAQDRTTHAVRSLAITLVAAPIIAIAIILAVVVATSSGSTSLMIITGIAGVIIGIGTLIVSLDELRKSKVS